VGEEVFLRRKSAKRLTIDHRRYLKNRDCTIGKCTSYYSGDLRKQFSWLGHELPNRSQSNLSSPSSDEKTQRRKGLVDIALDAQREALHWNKWLASLPCLFRQVKVPLPPETGCAGLDWMTVSIR
jgi:hypothetical protein